MILDSSEAMMLDSPSALTSRECRYLWEILKLKYADIELYDLDALQGYIALECAKSCRKGETPRYTIPRRKDDSLCYKMNPDGGIAKAYLKIDCPGQWNGRAISCLSAGRRHEYTSRKVASPRVSMISLSAPLA